MRIGKPLSGGCIPAPDRRDSINNLAFTAYAVHQTELDSIVDKIIDNFYAGNSSFTIELNDDFSEADREYIEKEVARRL